MKVKGKVPLFYWVEGTAESRSKHWPQLVLLHNMGSIAKGYYLITESSRVALLWCHAWTISGHNEIQGHSDAVYTSSASTQFLSVRFLHTESIHGSGGGGRKLSEFLYIEKPKNGILVIEFVFKILSKPLWTVSYFCEPAVGFSLQWICWVIIVPIYKETAFWTGEIYIYIFQIYLLLLGKRFVTFCHLAEFPMSSVTRSSFLNRFHYMKCNIGNAFFLGS